MDAPDHLVVHAMPNPRSEVQRVGFGLDHPYVEQCWVAVLGPTGTLVLRRLNLLWRDAEPARVDLADLASSLGLEGYRGGQRSKIWRTVERLIQFGFAERTGHESLGVYTELPPLNERKLRRLPASTRAAHERLLDAHVRQLSAGYAPPPGATDLAPLAAPLTPGPLEAAADLRPRALGR